MNTRLCLLTTVALTACAQPDLSGPPALKPGRDQCAECGMIINEDRCACGLLIDRDGIREHLVYDDLGCLFTALDTKEDMKVLGKFVRDYDGSGWIEFERATFLFADREKLPTPMGSGIVAYANPEPANAKRAALGGEIYDASGIRPAHTAWMESRFGKRR